MAQASFMGVQLETPQKSRRRARVPVKQRQLATPESRL